MAHDHLRQAGLKVTGPRIRILKTLQNADPRHLSAEQVHKLLCQTATDVGLATVYRVLAQFELAGLVKRHYFEGGHSVFELDDGQHHDHMVCLRCHEVTEFCDPVIENRQIHIAQAHDFKLMHHSLSLYGLCHSCQTKNSES